jgi:hypothetical protein
MANELEPRPEQAATTVKDLIPVSERGLVLRSLDDMFRFAQYLAQTRLTPKGLDTPSQILLAIQMGSELGLPPMASIQNIAVINGRPSIWGDAALAVCMEHPNYLDHDEDFDDATMTATCKVYTKKRGMDRPITRTFSMSDAKTAQLQGKSGPWTQYPKRMLQLRARGFALRDAFPGALRGLLTTEEVRDLPPRQVENEADEPQTTGKMAALVANVKRVEPETTPETVTKPPQSAVEATYEPEPPFDPDSPLDAPYSAPEGREPGSDDDGARSRSRSPTRERPPRTSRRPVSKPSRRRRRSPPGSSPTSWWTPGARTPKSQP